MQIAEVMVFRWAAEDSREPSYELSSMLIAKTTNTTNRKFD